MTAPAARGVSSALKESACRVLNFGPVRVPEGDKSGKYPDGNPGAGAGRRHARRLRHAPGVAPSGPAWTRSISSSSATCMKTTWWRWAACAVRRAGAPGRLAAARSWQGASAPLRLPGGARRAAPHGRARLRLRAAPGLAGYADGAQWDWAAACACAHHLPGHGEAGYAPWWSAKASPSSATSTSPASAPTTAMLVRPGPVPAQPAGRARSRSRACGSPRTTAASSPSAAFLQALERFAAKIDERDERLLGYLREGPRTRWTTGRAAPAYPVGYELPFVEFAERRRRPDAPRQACASRPGQLGGRGHLRSGGLIGRAGRTKKKRPRGRFFLDGNPLAERAGFLVSL